MKDLEFVQIAREIGVRVNTGGSAIRLGREIEKRVRTAIIDKLRNSAFMHTHVNPEHVLLCIKWDCTLLDAMEREKCHKCNGDGLTHSSTCPVRRDEAAMNAAAERVMRNVTFGKHAPCRRVPRVCTAGRPEPSSR